MFSAISAILIFAASWLGWTLFHNSNSSRKYPPGPPKHWLLGNLHDIPIQVNWGKLKVWKRDFGGLIYMIALGRSVLVVNDSIIAKELFDKRAKNYSHRPQTIMAGELIGLNRSMALYEYDEKYKVLRKLTQQAFAPHNLRKYERKLSVVVATFVTSLREFPMDFRSHSRVAAGRAILVTTYGLSPELVDNDYLADAERMLETVMKATFPGAYIVDFIPAMKYLPSWVPGASFRRVAKHASSLVFDHITQPFEHTLHEWRAGTQEPSYVSDLLNNAKDADVQNLWGSETEWMEAVKWAAGSMYSAGIDTTFSTILVFILCMSCHPEVQRRAMEEVDVVTRCKRPVTLADAPQLPYLSAVLNEVKRWHTVVPMAMPRVSQYDDIYNGQFIPAGTLVIPNIWSMSQDTEDPQIFRPERHLDNPKTQRPSEYVFGYGRRICPGRFLADNFIFMISANILANFVIEPSRQFASHNNPCFSCGLTSHPENFECCITPRTTSVDKER